MIEVILPGPLRELARIEGPVFMDVTGSTTQRELLTALETAYPTLRGTIRDQSSGKRRAYLRFFAGGKDISDAMPDAPLPASVAAGAEPFRVVGAMSGG